MNGLKSGFGFGAGAILAIAVLILVIIGGCCLCCFGLAVVAAMNEDSSVSRAPTRARPTRIRVTPTTAPVPASGETHNINEDVFVGQIRWKVLEATDLSNHLESQNQFTQPLQTSGKFIRVRFEIENRSGEAKMFSSVNLVDSSGRKFEGNSDAEIGFIDSNERCMLQQLNPNLPRVCTKIFEVPLDAKGLKLEVGDLDLLGTNSAVINLGL